MEPLSPFIGGSTKFNNESALTINNNTTQPPTEQPVVLEYTLLHHICKYIVYVTLPIIIIMGTFGNIMTLIIMNTMKSEKSVVGLVKSEKSATSVVNIFFTAVAIADLIGLYVHALDFWVGKVTGIFARAQSTVSCKLLMWLSSASATASCWLLVGLTVQRAMSVVWPHRVSLLCTRRTVLGLVFAVVLFCAVFYSHNIVGMDMSDLDNDGYYMCWTASERYHHFIQNIFVYMELTVFCLLPFTCLVISNTVLVWTLTRSVKRAREISTRTDQVSQKREKAASAVTLTVVVVSLTFMALTLPTSLYFMLFNNADLQFVRSWEDQLKIEAFFDISSVLANANSAINFYLYCLTGRRFRMEFFRVVSCCCGGGGGSRRT